MLKRILILSKFDSFARVAKRVADGFATRGFIVEQRLISAGREALSPRIYREIGLSPRTSVTTLEKLFSSKEDLAGFTAVYLGATGAFIRNFLGHMQQSFSGTQPRPLTLTGYPGVILKEKLSGFANRCGCDFIFLNSKADLEDYRRFCRNYNLEDKGGRLFGYCFPAFHKEQIRHIQRVLFVEQAVIPASLRERLYLAQQLLSYASHHPSQEIIIKPRLVPGEKSIFTPKHHIEMLLKSLSSLPRNLRIDYGNIQQLLEDADICLTVSSSVALQSMAYGIPTGIIRDFGVRDEYGTDFFRDSGCLITFEELTKGKMPVLHREWFEHNFISCDETLSSLIDAVEEEYNRRMLVNDWAMNKNLESIFCREYQNFISDYAKYRNRKRFLAQRIIIYFKANFKKIFQQ